MRRVLRRGGVRVAEFEPWENDLSEPGIPAEAETLLRDLRRYLRVLEWPRERRPYRPLLRLRDPAALADQAASRIPAPSRLAQEVLQVPSVLDRLRRVRRALGEEVLREVARRRRGRRRSNLHEFLVWKRFIRGSPFATGPNSLRANPIVAGDLLVASVSTGMVCAFDLETGRARWRTLIPAYPRSGVRLGPNRVLVTSTREVACLNVATGRIQWRFEPVTRPGEWVYSTAVDRDGKVFFGDRLGRLHVLEADSGRPLLAIHTSLERNNDFNATPLLRGDRVVVATNAGFAACHSVSTGEVAWRTHLDGPCSRIEALGDAELLAASGDTLFVLDGETGEIVHRWPAQGLRGWTVAGDRVLAVVENEGVCRRWGRRGTDLLFDVPAEPLAAGLTWNAETGPFCPRLNCAPHPAPTDRHGNARGVPGPPWALGASRGDRFVRPQPHTVRPHLARLLEDGGGEAPMLGDAGDVRPPHEAGRP